MSNYCYQEVFGKIANLAVNSHSISQETLSLIKTISSEDCLLAKCRNGCSYFNQHPVYDEKY